MLRTAKDLHGYSLRAHDGDIGKVHDVYFDEDAWTVRYVVVDTGGWLPGRKVLVSPIAIMRVDSDARSLAVDVNREQVKNSPDVNADAPVSRQNQAELHDYFRWPYYWTAGPYEGPGAYMGGAAESGATGATPPAAGVHPMTTQLGGDPHLHSARTVFGYGVNAQDGDMGRVHDIVFDDEGWVLRYFVVDTGAWLPGKKVLVALPWITRVAWEQSAIEVDLARDAIGRAPEYDSSRPVDRDYEIRLFEHYSREDYWTVGAGSGRRRV